MTREAITIKKALEAIYAVKGYTAPELDSALYDAICDLVEWEIEEATQDLKTEHAEEIEALEEKIDDLFDQIKELDEMIAELKKDKK